MNHKIISTKRAPEPGNYSQGILVDTSNCMTLYISGQTGSIPETDEVVEGGIFEQTKQALENIRGIVEAARGSIEDIAKINVSIKDMANNKTGFEQAYKDFFTNGFPARALVEVSEIPLVNEDTLVEIEAIAHISKERIMKICDVTKK